MEYNTEKYDTIDISYMSDGSGREFVILPDGGSRNPVNEKSFVMEDCGNGIRRSRLHEKMIGDEVFSYGIHYIPQLYAELQSRFNINSEDVDYLLLHQANKFLCEKLRKKLKFPPEKVPYNIQEFGNTSGGTIPLLMITNLQKELYQRNLNLIAATIGVGFSLGVAQIKTTGNIIIPDLLTL